MGRRYIILLVLLALSVFLVHRVTRVLYIYTVSPSFERPQKVTMPEGLASISAHECGVCHTAIYEEWKTTIHSQAWIDPYFQVDFAFDRFPQNCLNCHTPLENQQEHLVTGFRDAGKFNPLLEPNPSYAPLLRDEGVTCAVCHIDGDVIVGSRDIDDGPHPVRRDERFLDGKGVCKRCHVVQNTRWDAFLKIPPCGIFTEIAEMGKEIDCVKCHMPDATRAVSPGGEERTTGRHLWRGGHDPAKVKSALSVRLTETEGSSKSDRSFTLALTNVGTDHRLPTGTPDRHLQVSFRLYDADRNLLKEKNHFIERTIWWRPFIIDMWDNRIKSGETAEFTFRFGSAGTTRPAYLEAEVTYGLLHESRRRKIGYENTEPIRYSVFKESRSLR